ncbi:bactofilin family protein [Motilimonas pumila]|uniref:Polymer-forming cytoskeletal protein n=1 Tax=Motilimonas pumila TaxID=2303987 RepID=A0A418YIF9_9GAMM|nr:polymer-forming cytoskeletal protein [Motilimonas pumila]RJG50420.1 polymer-forming cytoskeletal protein [Motilimonas pumila]
MFKKIKEEDGLTYISENCAITGDLNLKGEVIINGTVEGTLTCDGNVTIGRNGNLIGVLRATEVFVSGKIDGETHCEILNVENKGEVNGELFSNDIRIDRGGQFFGVRKQKIDDKKVLDFDKKSDDKKQDPVQEAISEAKKVAKK